MMTFIEFLNRQDDRPITNLMKMKSGLQVSQDFSQDILAPKVSPPSFKAPSLISSSTMLGGRKLSDRPIAKKPTDFLARKGSSFRKSV